MNYIDAIILRLSQILEDCDEDLLRLYALLVLTTGESTTETDIHNAWAIYMTKIFPEHWSLIPFKELQTEIQEKDTQFTQVIRLIASELNILEKS